MSDEHDKIDITRVPGMTIEEIARRMTTILIMVVLDAGGEVTIDADEFNARLADADGGDEVLELHPEEDGTVTVRAAHRFVEVEEVPVGAWLQMPHALAVWVEGVTADGYVAAIHDKDGPNEHRAPREESTSFLARHVRVDAIPMLGGES